MSFGELPIDLKNLVSGFAYNTEWLQTESDHESPVFILASGFGGNFAPKSAGFPPNVKKIDFNTIKFGGERLTSPTFGGNSPPTPPPPFGGGGNDKHCKGYRFSGK